MSKEIVIDILPDGSTVKFEGHGFQGGECRKLAEALEDAVGERVAVDLKPEFRQAAVKPVTRTQ